MLTSRKVTSTSPTTATSAAVVLAGALASEPVLSPPSVSVAEESPGSATAKPFADKTPKGKRKKL